MSKVIGVALVGGLLLGGLLYLKRDKTEDQRPDPSALFARAPGQHMGTASPAMGPLTAPPAAGAASDTPACAHLVDLCSTHNDKVDPEACEKELADARKMAGPANVERSEECIAEATTCAAASGCISGGVGMGAMGELLKGFGGALSR